MTAAEYDLAVLRYKKIEDKIQKNADRAWKEIKEFVTLSNDKEEESTLVLNERSCDVCGNKTFVMKYRDVNGEIEGETSGYFSLFGGSISGFVKGKIGTRPILSCRKCENERPIILSRHIYNWQYLADLMPKYYGYSVQYTEANQYLIGLGLEVTRKLAEHLFYPDEYTRIDKFSDDVLIKCGLNYKYPRPPVKPMFYSLRKFFRL